MVASKLVRIAALLALAACATTISQNERGRPASRGKADRVSLKREDAVSRAKHVSQVSYQLWFDLDGSAPEFEGRAVIQFELRIPPKGAARGIFLDFEGGRVRSLNFNNSRVLAENEISRERYDGHRIYFDLDELQLGSNRIEVSFAHPYAESSAQVGRGQGHGLSRFVDTADRQVYLFSNLKPFGAHDVFPCFDQPDLKASFELTVEAPQHWTVIANTLERDVASVDSRKSWAFPPSPRLSPHLFALHAGPYAKWESNSSGIPLRLFARKSVAPRVEKGPWFEAAEKGLDFFSVQLGYPYPYAKYDQIIAPGLAQGAIESAAATLYSEKWMLETRPSETHLRDRVRLILHELAQSWFGSLVSVRWWNAQWLNESFAIFMSAWALDEVFQYQGIWLSFFENVKVPAYNYDQSTVAHPVEMAVSDADYESPDLRSLSSLKGAALLKELRFFLGEDDFREGVQRYFQKYALRSTTAADFMKMFSQASGMDMIQWQKSWLQKSGVDHVRLNWACEIPKPPVLPNEAAARARRRKRKSEPRLPLISVFQILQPGAEPLNASERVSGRKKLSATRRQHRMEIALYDMDGTGKLKPRETIQALYSGPETSVAAAIGTPCPDFVLLNHGDHDYVKVTLDGTDMERASRFLNRFEAPLSRRLVWGALWDGVLGGELRALRYQELVIQHLKNENQAEIVSGVLENAIAGLRFLSGTRRAKDQERLEAFIRRRLASAAAQTGLQAVLLQKFTQNASGPDSVRWIKALLTGRALLPGFEPRLQAHQKIRWELLGVLARAGDPEARKWIGDELAKDSSDFGRRAAIAAEVQLPDEKIRRLWLERILKPDLPVPVPAAVGSLFAEAPLSPPELRQAVRHLRTEGLPEFPNAYLAKLEAWAAGQEEGAADEAFQAEFTWRLFPEFCEQGKRLEIADRLTALTRPGTRLPDAVVHALKIRIEEEELCLQRRTSFSVPAEPDSGPSPSPSVGVPPV
ncbi:MAG: hypothetical protein A2428_03570 [Bdellovibrionales bacterium RIFOXYC1_FULL_54_43]|nr:MAG: hypothetical protein A2428_03570 [Bdellovibrionales bacterium RIFOXYC1_FULL_54_43]OFZ81591.1 MAG: hypothetical protein A2603_14960 [Bdellovibrionales bacterium RIFOXYD1_FULL_55_31]